jgi:methylated-DNA-[protein]-cysteine S-methyltransferase
MEIAGGYGRMNHYARMPSPLGPMLLASNGTHVTGVFFVGQKYEPRIGPDWIENAGVAVLAKARQQLEEYFTGERIRFDLPLRLAGTPFQRRVWRALLDIDFGATASYAEVAHAAGVPRAVRAVGAAVGRNPVSIVVPCHRVLGSDGALTGYAGGVERKRALLAQEAGRSLAQRPLFAPA